MNRLRGRQLLLLDKGIGLSEIPRHLRTRGHILLGLLCFLLAGGGQVVAAFSSGSTAFPLSQAEYQTGHGPASPLEAVLFEERPGGCRPAEARTANGFPLSVWIDPYLPPSLGTTRIAAAEGLPIRRRARFSSALARAPPSCR